MPGQMASIKRAVTFLRGFQGFVFWTLDFANFGTINTFMLVRYKYFCRLLKRLAFSSMEQNEWDPTSQPTLHSSLTTNDCM